MTRPFGAATKYEFERAYCDETVKNAARHAAFVPCAAAHGVAMAVPDMAQGTLVFSTMGYGIGKLFSAPGSLSGKVSDIHGVSFPLQKITMRDGAALGVLTGLVNEAQAAAWHLLTSLYGLEAKLHMTNESFQAAEKKLAACIGRYDANRLRDISKSGKSSLFVALDAERLEFERDNPHAPIDSQNTEGERDDPRANDLSINDARVISIFRNACRTLNDDGHSRDALETKKGEEGIKLACDQLDIVWREAAPATFAKLRSLSIDALRRKYRVATAQSYALPPARTQNYSGAELNTFQSAAAVQQSIQERSPIPAPAEVPSETS